MGLVVQKYGGSSLDTPVKIKELAGRIVERYKSGDSLVIVVSATGKTTDELRKRAFVLAEDPDPRELDMLISVGERESISLMSIAINSIYPGLARSFTGSQIGLITDCSHGKARILEIKGDRLKTAVGEGKIPVIAGFQGVSTDKEITTLGRGGSDTTAVAVAAAMNADVCEIYSDVKGIYTADPKRLPEAELIGSIDYDTMLTLSSAGAKVLKDSAVEYAKRLGVTIRAGESSTGYVGTIVSDSGMNKSKFTAVTENCGLFCAEYHEKESGVPLSCPVLFITSNGKNLSVSGTRTGGASECCSLTLVGTGLRSEWDTIKKAIEIISGYTGVIAHSVNNIKFEIFYKKKLSDKVFSEVYSIFFNRS